MVAKISQGQSIAGMLNYNEQKVRQGKAKCIAASKYGLSAQQLNFQEKLSRLQNLAEQNSRSKTNALHISLNFDPAEKPSVEQLHSIATRYMDLIGFGQQPFLVYQHFDAGHPHIHIATTNIQPGGKRIDLHNIGRNQSEAARKMIENEYGLIKAEAKQSQAIKTPHIEKIVYGQTDTKRAITNLLSQLIRQYNFTSLAEFNVLLRQYNIIADRGKEDTQLYQKRGLIYQLLDAKGERVGVPIKASAIYGKPTLNNLEKCFTTNEQKRKYPKALLKNTLDRVFHMNPKMDRAQFIRLLKDEQVDAIFRQNSKGETFGLNFIDHKTKTVFKGSEVAGHYSAKKVLEKLEPGSKLTIPQQTHQTRTPKQIQTITPLQPTNSDTNLLELLLQDKPYEEGIAPALKRKKRRKQRLQ
jgi:hypothetical protein